MVHTQVHGLTGNHDNFNKNHSFGGSLGCQGFPHHLFRVVLGITRCCVAFRKTFTNVVTQFFTMAMVPAIAAIIVRAWITKEGFADAGLRPNFRNKWRYYLIALALPVGFLIIATGLVYLFDLQVDSLPDNLGAHILLQILTCIPSSIVLWGEEFGWTAYMRDQLLLGRPAATTLLTGFIWGIWHAPLPLVGYGGVNANTNIVLMFFMWIPLCTVIEIIIGWLWEKSGTTWTSSLLHSGVNIVLSGTLAVLIRPEVDTNLQMILACVSIIPFAVLAIWLMSRNKNHPVTADIDYDLPPDPRSDLKTQHHG